MVSLNGKRLKEFRDRRNLKKVEEALRRQTEKAIEERAFKEEFVVRQRERAIRMGKERAIREAERKSRAQKAKALFTPIPRKAARGAVSVTRRILVPRPVKKARARPRRQFIVVSPGLKRSPPIIKKKKKLKPFRIRDPLEGWSI